MKNSCNLVLSFVLALGLLPGCGNSGSNSTAPTERTSQHKLNELADLLRMLPKPPTKIAELKALSQEYPFAVDAVVKGEFLVIPGVVIAGEGDSKGNGKIIAYEKKTPNEGGMALYDDGKVKEISAADFKALGLPDAIK